MDINHLTVLTFIIIFVLNSWLTATVYIHENLLLCEIIELTNELLGNQQKDLAQYLCTDRVKNMWHKYAAYLEKSNACLGSYPVLCFGITWRIFLLFHGWMLKKNTIGKQITQQTVFLPSKIYFFNLVSWTMYL